MSLSSFGLLEKLKLAPIFAGKAQEKGVSVDRLSDFDKIDILSTTTNKSPNEWVYWYALADSCSSEGFYTLGLDACEKCLQLRPNDPRSTYAIATLYRVLTRAKYVGNPKAKEFQDALSNVSNVLFDPKLSAKGLEHIGITIEEAAKKSIQYFEKTLKLRISRSEEQHVKSILKELHEDFPPTE